MQLPIRDYPRPLSERGFIYDGLVLSVAEVDVPVDAVVRHVGEPASEPPVERRPRLIQHLVPLLKPLQVAHLLCPEILPGAWIQRETSMLIIGLLRDSTLDGSEWELKDSLLKVQGL